jgi:opacity protein-like surface antigen
MKKFALAAAMALALGGTANAGLVDYAKMFGGATLEPSLSAPEGSGLDMDTGYNLGAALGWNVSPNVSLEAELFYTSSGFSNFDARLETMSVMGNAYYNFDCGWKAMPFIGVGVGGVQVNHNDKFASTSGSDFVFGYQAMAGFTYNLTPSMDLLVEYRYQGSGDAHIVDSVHPLGGDQEYKSHNLSIGIRFDL